MMFAFRIAAPLLGFVVAALALVPLRTVLAMTDSAASGLTHTAASGTVWNGTVRGADWRGAPLGDLRVSLQPAPLVTGQIAADFRAAGPVSSGVLAARDGAWRFERLNGRIALSAFAPGLPPEAALYLTGASLAPSPQGCAAASGRVNVDGLPAPAPASLEGALSCDSGDLVIALSPPQGGGEILARIRLSGDPAQRFTLTSADPSLRAALDMLGLPVADAAP